MSRQQQKLEQRVAMLEGQLATVSRERAAPRVTGAWAGLVQAAPGAILAGATIALTPPMFVMSGWGAQAAFNMPADACIQVGGLFVVAGTGVAVLAIVGDVLDFGEIGTVAVNRFFDYWEGRAERKAQAPKTRREVPIYSRNEQQASFDLPADTEFKTNTLTITSVNTASGEREIAVDKVCLFLKSAVASGNWSRDTQTVLNKKEHPDVKAYLEKKGFWMLKPPTLPRACAQLRGGDTN